MTNLKLSCALSVSARVKYRTILSTFFFFALVGSSYAINGQVTGIDISDEMIRVARESSGSFPNADFEVAGADELPFTDNEFTHAFSMESLYYYTDIPKALAEIHRVLRPRGLFVAVVDLYWESKATHQWIDDLMIPVILIYLWRG